MKFRIDKKYIHWGMTAFSVIAASIFFYYLLFHRESISSGFHTFVSVTMPILDGLLVAFILSAYPDIKRSGKAVPDTVVHKISYRC